MLKRTLAIVLVLGVALAAYSTGIDHGRQIQREAEPGAAVELDRIRGEAAQLALDTRDLIGSCQNVYAENGRLVAIGIAALRGLSDDPEEPMGASTGAAFP